MGGWGKGNGSSASSASMDKRVKTIGAKRKNKVGGPGSGVPNPRQALEAESPILAAAPITGGAAAASTGGEVPNPQPPIGGEVPTAWIDELDPMPIHVLSLGWKYFGDLYPWLELALKQNE